MNPLVQTSNHSPKNSDKDIHASRTYGNPPIKLGSESLPLCFLDLRNNSNPKARQNKKQKSIKPSSIGRTKTYDYHVTRKQKDNNKKNTSNE